MSRAYGLNENQFAAVDFFFLWDVLFGALKKILLWGFCWFRFCCLVSELHSSFLKCTPCSCNGQDTGTAYEPACFTPQTYYTYGFQPSLCLGLLVHFECTVCSGAPSLAGPVEQNVGGGRAGDLSTQVVPCNLFTQCNSFCSANNSLDTQANKCLPYHIISL